MTLTIPDALADTCCDHPERTAWLTRLPRTITELTHRWSLTDLGTPYPGGSCAWVAPVIRADGTTAALKIAMPHMEAAHEIDGLRFWDGSPTARLLDAGPDLNALLLERCLPGTPLRTRSEPEQDKIIAEMLRRLWRRPPEPHPFRPLATMLTYWAECTRRDADLWPDAALIEEGLALFDELPQSAPRQVLLATDLHAGNVLRAEREPWLVIDPKPFVGDPAYDATQHLFNCRPRLLQDPHGLIHRMAETLEVDHDRLRLWTFARLTAEPRSNWRGDDWRTTVARALATAP